MGGSAFLIRNPYVYVYTYVHKNAYSSRYCEQKPKYLEDFSSICGVYGRALCLRHKLRQSRRLPTDNKKTEFCEVLNCIYSQIHTHTHTHILTESVGLCFTFWRKGRELDQISAESLSLQK